jgi:FkbM family methyltransferase
MITKISERIDELEKKYNLQTSQIIKKVVNKDSICIDVGCHAGAILEQILKVSPLVRHYAFEPLPDLYKNLTQKFKHTNVQFFDVALTDSEGLVNFNYVTSFPMYSGFKKRRNDRDEEQLVEEIMVKSNMLDNFVNETIKVDFIKIDVEGAEFQVLKGSVNTLKRDHPVIIFEHGLGASNFYGTTPTMIFDFLTTLNYKIYLMDEYLLDGNCLSLHDLIDQYNTNDNYLFCASV